MAVSKSTIGAVERSIRQSAAQLTSQVQNMTAKGAPQRLYALRQTLLVLAKVRASFDPEYQELAPATSEPLGFQTRNEIELDEEFEVDDPETVPEARRIGFRPRA